MRLPAIAAAAAGLLLLAADDPNKKDLDKLQGTWVVESAQSGGKDVAVEQLPFQGVLFQDGTFAYLVGAMQTRTGTFSVDASMKPATIDMLGKDGKKITPGIYEFDGDALKMAFTGDERTRPGTLVSKAGSDTVVVTLKRQKK